MKKTILAFMCFLLSASVAFSCPDHEEQNEAYVCSQYVVGIAHMSLLMVPVTLFKKESGRVPVEGKGATKAAAEIDLNRNLKEVYNECQEELAGSMMGGECKVEKIKCRKFGEQSDEEEEE